MLKVQFDYYNPLLNIAFSNWRQIYLVQDDPIMLKPEIHRSALVYRMPLTGKRISYKQIKKDLLKQNIILKFELLPKIEKINWL